MSRSGTFSSSLYGGTAMNQRPLDGKIALVTGAGSNIGLGRAMTLALVRAGARVAMMDIDADSLERSANDARGIGGKDSVTTIVGDATKPEDGERAVRATSAALGGLAIM